MTDTKSNSEETILNNIFERVGKEYGFSEVTAEYATFRDMKMKWTRTNDWINFDVSDYLKGAPENVIEGLATATLKKIRGDESDTYTPEIVEYLTSDEFVEKNRATYLKRFRGISEGTQGFHIDLQESYDRLVKKGLVDDDPSLVIRWAGNARTRIGSSSLLMRVITLTKAIDCDTITDNLIDYALYSQIVHLNLGFNPEENPMLRAAKYQEMLNQYPGRDAAEQELISIGIRC